MLQVLIRRKSPRWQVDAQREAQRLRDGRRGWESVLLGLPTQVTPNHFELEHLTGVKVSTMEQALAAARSLLKGPRLALVTSLRRADAPASASVRRAKNWTARVKFWRGSDAYEKRQTVLTVTSSFPDST